MRIKRKPLLLEAWHNSKGPTPGDRPAEPIPRWLSVVAERDAKPDTTFILKPEDPGTVGKVIHAGHVVYRSPDGSIESISMDRFKQEYDVIDLQPKKVEEDPV